MGRSRKEKNLPPGQVAVGEVVFSPKGWDNIARGNAPGRRRLQ
jgi:hypothetical protein